MTCFLSSTRRAAFALSLTAAALALLVPQRAVAQQVSDWVSDTSGEWSNGSFWTNAPSASPYATNILRFFGTTNMFVTNDLANPFELHGLAFQNSGGTGSVLSLSGGALRFLLNGAVQPGITNNGTSLVSIANNVEIGSGVTNLNLAGAGGVVTIGGVISGSGSLTKLGAHTNILTSGANTYSGDTLVTAGLLAGVITNDNGTPFGTGSNLRMIGGTLSLRADGITNLVVGGGSGYNVIAVSNNNGTINADRFAAPATNVVYKLNNLIVSNATLGLSSGNGGSVQFEGVTTLGGTTAVFNASSGTHVLNGNIVEANSGVTLRKIGGGTLILNTNGNSVGYSGTTVIDGGNLQVLFTTTSNTVLPGSTVWLRGGALQIRATNSLTAGPGSGYNFMVVSNGSTINADRIGATAANNVIQIGGITFTNNTVLGQNSALIATNINFSTGNGYTLLVAGAVTIASNAQFSVASNVVFNGVIQESGPGPGGYSIRKLGVGRLFITNSAVSNTYSGGTFIDQGQLQATADPGNPAPLGQGDITLRGGTLDIRTTNSQAFGPGANGYNVTVQSNTSTINVDRPGAVGANNTIDINNLIISSVTTNTNGVTLAVTGGNGYALRVLGAVTLQTNAIFSASTNFIVNGLISDSGGSRTLTKSGVGRMFLTNGVDHQYTGGTLITAGQLQIAGLTNNSTTLGSGPVTLAGGALELRADSNFVFGAGLGYSPVISNSGTISVDRISTNGGVNQIVYLNNIGLSNGTLTVNGANGYALQLNGQLIGPDFVLDNGANNIISNNVINVTGTGALLFTNPFTIAGANTVSGLRFDNTVTLDGPTTITNAGGTMVFNGQVVNGSTPASLNKLGAGTFQFNNSSNTFSGPITFNGGVVLGVASNDNSTPFGQNANVIVDGGTLQLRSPGNSPVFGPGLGYVLNINSNATVDVNRSGTTGTGQAIMIGGLVLKDNRVNFTGGNAYRLENDGTTTLEGTVFLNVNTVGSLTLNEQILQSAPGARLIKEGASNLIYAAQVDALHSGGTIITNGSQVRWQHIRLPQTNAGGNIVYNFGTGPITLDGNSTWAFQGNVSSNYTFGNAFNINDKVATGQLTGDGGGTIDFTRNGGSNSPVVTNIGAVMLGGTLRLQGPGANNGSTTPGIIRGNITISGGDREITAVNRVADGNGRFIVSGNIGNDGSPRNLWLRANNTGGLELSGTNSGVNNMYIAPSYQGGIGRVRFAVSNSLPSGKVTVESGTVVGIGFNTTNLNGVATPGISALASGFVFKPNSIVGLEGIKPHVSVPLDLSASGLNADIMLGALEGTTVTLSNSITPFGSVYKLGGGGGTLNHAGTNFLTGANSLVVNPNPFASPVAAAQAATVAFTAANGFNTYSGGTLVNQGTLNINSGRSQTPLGTGPIDVYGTLNVLGGAATGYGSLAGPDGLTNNNVLRLHPGATLQLGATANPTGGTTNRFGDNENLTLYSARLNFVGQTNINPASTPAVTNTETIGNLTYALGSRLNIQAQTTSNLNAAFLTVNNIIRSSSGGTLELIRNATGVNNTEFGAQSRIISTTPLTVVNGMIHPSIVSFGAAAAQSTFVTYDSTVDATGFQIGIKPATYVTGVDPTTGSSTDIYDLAGTPTNIVILGGNANVYALRSLTNNIRGAVDVTLGSGGLIIGSTSNDFRFIAGSLATPTEGFIYVTTGTAVFTNDFVAAGITKFGPGTMTLANSNRSYAGGWNVDWGTLNVSGSNALGSASAGNVVKLNSGQNTVNLTFNQNANDVVYNSGPIVSHDNNVINLAPGAADRIISIAPMDLILTNINGGPLGSRLRVTMNQDRTLGRILGDLVLATDSYLDLSSTVAGRISTTNRLDIAGNLIGLGRTLTKYGSASLGLTNDNSATWLGGTINVNYGALQGDMAGSFGNAASIVNIASNAVLQIGASTVNFSPLATVNQAPGSAERWLGQFNRFNANSASETYSVPANVNLQVSVNMAGTNKTIRLNSGSGLEGYQFSDDSRGNSIQIGRLVTVDLAGDAKIGSSGVDLGRSGTQTILLGNVTESGGSRSLTKVGLDTVNLLGSNTFSGGLNVNRGTVLLGNNIIPTNGVVTNGFAAGTGPVTVAAQAMLGGTNGAINGPLTIQSGGMLMPGVQGTVSTLAAAGGLTLAAGSIFDVDINATNSFDRVWVTGGVSLTDSILNLRLGANIPLTATNLFVLIDNDGVDPITGTFAGLPEGSLISVVGGTSDGNFSGLFSLTYFGQDGNDLVLTAVPEPGTVGLLVLGGILCGIHVLRRRRTNA
jgi:autotransporter-associated beta strand protein